MAVHRRQCSCYRRGNSCIPCVNGGFTRSAVVSEEYRQRYISGQ